MSKRMGRINWRNLCAALVFAFAVVGGQLLVPLQVHAAGATRTWTGTAGDGKFSTAGNWTTAAPVVGDIISFPATDGLAHTLNNDLGVAFAGVTYGSGNVSFSTSYTINTLALQANAAVTRSGYAASITISGSVSAAGALTFNGTSSPFYATGPNVNVSFTNLTISNAPLLCSGGLTDFVNWRPTGTVTIGGTSIYSLVGTEAAVIAQANATLSINGGTHATNITLNGAMTDDGGCDADRALAVFEDTTLTGTITLNNNASYYVALGKTLTITGVISGPSFSLQKASGSTGTFINNASSNNSNTPSGTQEVPVTELPAITDSQPGQVLNVGSKTIVTLDGERGNTTVNDQAILKGTGTVADLYVAPGGIVAPGHSPGKLTVLQTLNLFGIYQAELQNKDLYDQLEVGSGYSGGGNAVTLNSGSQLNLSLYGSYAINQGDTFTIINNRSNTAVSGVFDNLAEGAQFVVGAAVFSISYVGGDGNDVVITALKTVTAPGTPNTGAFKLDMANPVTVAAIGVVAAIVLLVVFRRFARR